MRYAIVLLLTSSAFGQALFRGQNVIPAATGTSFVTSVDSTGSNVNTFTGVIGFRLTVGGSPITVTQLGRYCLTGNSASHTLYVLDLSANSLGSVSVNMSGCTPGTFVYGTVSVALSASTGYYIVSSELNTGDEWFNGTGTSISHTAVGTVPHSCYGAVGVLINEDNNNDETYGPVNFKYT